ncbi:xanthine dehydrogenase family protein subunit M [Alicyclobacillus cycloheptanicus]|uniref:Carbon-monoxide dehydrogenase medium subunit n=1 Tax=Alicyclobacillus cycloheptanicus TaxID=1457 RepID=A0ABT9XHT5_9BACL|nr:xanthine dehydrogenase family protein subunit M [Alicyclobacillus cycloheptanicus]MDQ0189855.1 carbon-monoxide dehydrogenase medium subunit [Alicyclobacillus cycloheptanicus]WDM02461.1 xanthine dehydrogenase family protein subunit M [Alicyclobacillus cycloheptanicus]
MQPFKLSFPTTVDEALSLQDTEAEAIFWGGGAASTILMKQGLLAPDLVIGLERVSELYGISRLPDGAVRLGAMTRLRDIELSPFLAGVIPSLSETASVIANVRVRNVATLGGHLVHADPAQDLPPLLLALDASVKLRSADAERTVPLDAFFVDTMETAIAPDEIMMDVTIPAAAIARRSRYVKFRPRSQDDYCTVGVAASVAFAADGHTIADVRIAVGGAGPVACRIADAEQLLIGHEVNDGRLDDVSEVVRNTVEPWDDARGSEQYKRDMAAVWTKRVLRSLVDQKSDKGMRA